MTTADPHVLLEMSDEPDCRFVAAWLFRAAQAQGFWWALANGESGDEVSLLCADIYPDLAAFALETLGEMEHRYHVVAFDLYSDETSSYEFALMERLGFFVYGSRSYWMALPKTIKPAAVRRAALEVLSVAEDEGHGFEVVMPERLMQTLSKTEAEALRARLIALRRFKDSLPGSGRHSEPRQ